MKELIKLMGTTINLIIKSLVKLGGLMLKLVYLIVKAFDSFVAKMFNKLPRLVKVTICYLLIGLSALNFVTIPTKQNNQEQLKEVAVMVETETEEVEVVELVEVEEVVETETTNNCTINNEIACAIYNNAISKGLTNEQALIIVSISAHETGYWKSSLFVNNYNFGGLCNSKGFLKYESFEEGLNAMVDLLQKYYFENGYTTIEKIGSKYCPVGAKNDPTNLNANWVPSVTSIYNNYLTSVN